jgi:hypothetical protein
MRCTEGKVEAVDVVIGKGVRTCSYVQPENFFEKEASPLKNLLQYNLLLEYPLPLILMNLFVLNLWK